jgi:hypothetical protein
MSFNFLHKVGLPVIATIGMAIIVTEAAADVSSCLTQLFNEHKRIVRLFNQGNYDEGYSLATVAYKRGNRLAGHEICKLPLIPRHKGKVGSLQTSAEVCRTLAMTGDGIMQEAYARLLSSGSIEPKHRDDEVYFTKEAALAGMSWAQGEMAVRFGTGKGVPKDYVQSYMMANLAHSQGFKPVKKILDILEGSMPQKTVLEAQRMARDFAPRKRYRKFKGEIDCTK